MHVTVAGISKALLRPVKESSKRSWACTRMCGKYRVASLSLYTPLTIFSASKTVRCLSNWMAGAGEQVDQTVRHCRVAVLTVASDPEKAPWHVLFYPVALYQAPGDGWGWRNLEKSAPEGFRVVSIRADQGSGLVSAILTGKVWAGWVARLPHVAASQFACTVPWAIKLSMPLTGTASWLRRGRTSSWNLSASCLGHNRGVPVATAGSSERRPVSYLCSLEVQPWGSEL